jgi:2-polyprenyl-6-methoxyphenol hydroxylase-like FAD-dependent oxidoreductase
MTVKSVLISGAGIAGPTLAYWLAAYGFEPTLIERAPRLRTGGYIIDFWGLGYDIAGRMGLLPDLERKGFSVEQVRFVNESGRRVSGFDVDVFRKLTGGRYVSLPRGDLAELIYRTIENRCEIIFGDSITAIEERGDGVAVSFERSPARSFDLVVGADGLHSAVRKLVFGSQSGFEKYLGYMVAVFESKGYRPRDEGVYLSFAVPGKQVARYAMRDDRTVFLFVFASAQPPSAAPHDMPAQKAILHRQYDEAGWESAPILQALDRCDDLYFDRVSQIRMDSWSRGRVVLVGDAAFCPSLLAGQGSALAMTAAYVLAGELAKAEGQFQPAFERYETLLRPFMAGKQKAAEQFAGSFAPKTRFGLFLRNQITKAFDWPLVANVVIGNSLLDRLTLPEYPKRDIA